ncbi:MAG: DUF6098 family protein [Georgenia sp.]
MDDYAAAGGDPGAHATLFGLAGAGGALGGNAALSAIPMVKVAPTASRLARMGVRAAEGALTNSAASGIGSVMEGADGGEAAKRMLLSALAGGAMGGAMGMRNPKAVVPNPMSPAATDLRANLLASLDPKDRRFALNDPHFARVFSPNVGRPLPAVRRPVPMLNLKARSGKMDFRPRHSDPRSMSSEIQSVADLRRLLGENAGLYVRWSRGEALDKSSGERSRDWVTGRVHAGLSAIRLDPEWSAGRIARALNEYGHLRASAEGLEPHIYSGRLVGRDSDGYDSIRDVRTVARVAPELIRLLDRGLADALSEVESVQSIAARLDRIRASLAEPSLSPHSRRDLERGLSQTDDEMRAARAEVARRIASDPAIAREIMAAYPDLKLP